MARAPKHQSSSEKEIEKIQEQFDAHEKSLKEMTHDRLKNVPLEEIEPQTKIAQRDLEKAKDIYLKPKRTISSKEKFNEKFRDDYNFQKEYVQFVAENKEIIGETIDLWTKPFAGMPAEEWEVPTNKPVWGPRYLAERIHNCKYHRFIMNQQQSTGTDGHGQYYGAMVADTTIQRLDAHPASTKKSIFMGANSF